MEITLKLVEQARSDPSTAVQIFKSIFYDGKKPKLRMWLIKKGVDFQELDDVESVCKLEFMKQLYKYNHDKIAFEKYVWTEFSHILLNHFQSKKSKKVSLTDSLDEKLGDDADEYRGNVYMNLGFIPNPDCESDFETVFNNMTRIQATICRLIYYSELDKNEIIEFLNIGRDKYVKEVKQIRIKMKQYLVEGLVG